MCKGWFAMIKLFGLSALLLLMPASVALTDHSKADVNLPAPVAVEVAQL